MAGPLVSICIPAYNAASTLRTTLESLLAQTYQHIEILISDNASTDDTVAIAASVGGDRVTIHHSEVNVGGEGNFERCIHLGKGKYTAIFHADDVYTPTMVEKQVAYLEANPEVGAVFTASTVIDQDGRTTAIYQPPPFLQEAKEAHKLEFLETFRAVMTHGNFLVCPSFMVRTSIYQNEIKTWRGQQFGSSADLDVWLRILLNHPIGFIPEPLIRYRRSPLQGSHQIHYLRTTRADFFRVIDHYLALPEIAPLLNQRDLANYQRLCRKDAIVRACNALIKEGPQGARSILEEVSAREVILDAPRSKRELLLLGTWLAIQLGLWPVRPVVLPLLRYVARRRA